MPEGDRRRVTPARRRTQRLGVRLTNGEYQRVESQREVMNRARELKGLDPISQADFVRARILGEA